MDLFSDAEWEILDGYESMTPDAARAYRESVISHGLDPWTIRIFAALRYGYGQVRDDELFKRNAFGRFLQLFPQAAMSAVDRCWKQGWIQHLSRDFLLSQQAEIETGGYEVVSNLIGQEPRSLEEMIGVIDLTPKGVVFICNHEKEHLDHWAIRVIDRQSGEIFGTSDQACRFPLEMCWPFENNSPVQIHASEAIGRWCDRWWRRFEEGHRIRFRVHDEEVAAALLGEP